MIALPQWMFLTEPSPLPPHRRPLVATHVVASIIRAGYDCDYAGAVGRDLVFLVGTGRTTGRLLVQLAGGTCELWPNPADPNGMPASWARFGGKDDVAVAAADLVSRTWPQAAPPLANST